MKSNILIQKEKNCVIKILKTKVEFKKELYIYKKRLSITPKLLDTNRNFRLTLEYINGKSIGKLNQPNFIKIARLFVSLHSTEKNGNKCICQNDTNPNNYLYSEERNRYFMIDFGEWEYNYPETDLIHFLLFWASIYKKDDFKRISTEFISAYKIDREINPIRWLNLFPEITKKFDIRRAKFNKIEKSYNNDNNINRKILRDYFK